MESPVELPSHRAIALASWPQLTLSVTAEQVAMQHLLPPSGRHHVLLVRGDVTLEVQDLGKSDRRSVRISRGEILFRPAGLPAQHHRWQAAAPFEIVHALLSPAYCPDVERTLRDPGAIYKLEDPMVASLIECLERAVHRGALAEDRSVRGSADLLGLRIAELLPRASTAFGQGGLSAAVLRRVCDHIDDQLAEPIEVATLAGVAKLSASHFARSFKAATGVSPKRFVRTRRILMAQELLRSSDKPLVDIAFETGFGSQSLFTTTFSSLVGESPSRFRRHHAARGVR